MSEIELKPCPFCDSPASIGNNFGRAGVSCTSCEASMRYNGFGDESPQGKINASWNTRAPVNSHKALKEALEGMVDLYEYVTGEVYDPKKTTDALIVAKSVLKLANNPKGEE